MTKQLTPLRRKDQATGYAKAVKDIVAWLKSGSFTAFAVAEQIEAKFGNRVDTV